ncbi:MAG: hypothetical protein ACYTGN_19035 [Planctomycetota bacterium]|jgi:hypothetical protein
MAFLTELWLPIVLSAVLVFVVSSIIHMALPIHKGDMQKLGGEEAVLESMRAQNVTPGSYMFPCAESMKAMGSPEMLEKFKRGPVGYMTVLPNGAPAIGKNLVNWFLYSLVVGALVAYVAHHALAPGAKYYLVFRVTGTAAILGYAIGALQDSIWKGQSWKITGKFVFDGAIYGLCTAGAFAGFWPDAV